MKSQSDSEKKLSRYGVNVLKLLLGVFLNIKDWITILSNKAKVKSEEEPDTRVLSEKVYVRSVKIMLVVGLFGLEFDLDYLLGLLLFLAVTLITYFVIRKLMLPYNLSEEVEYLIIGDIFRLPLIIITLVIIYISFFYDVYKMIDEYDNLSWLLVVFILMYLWKISNIKQVVYTRNYVLGFYRKFYLWGITIFLMFFLGMLNLVGTTNDFYFLLDSVDSLSRYENMSLFDMSILVIIVAYLRADMILAKRLDCLWECEVTKEKSNNPEVDNNIEQLIINTPLENYKMNTVLSIPDFQIKGEIERFDFIFANKNTKKLSHTRNYTNQRISKPKYDQVASSLYSFENCKLTNEKILFVGSKAKFNYEPQYKFVFKFEHGAVYYNLEKEKPIAKQIYKTILAIHQENDKIIYSQILFTSTGLYEFTPVSYWQSPPILIISNKMIDKYLAARKASIQEHLNSLEQFNRIKL